MYVKINFIKHFITIRNQMHKLSPVLVCDLIILISVNFFSTLISILSDMKDVFISNCLSYLYKTLIWYFSCHFINLKFLEISGKA